MDYIAKRISQKISSFRSRDSYDPAMSKIRAILPTSTSGQAFALRLKKLRADHGQIVGQSLSRKAFAALLGIKQATLGSYERGDREPPLQVLAAFRRVTGASLDDLIGDWETPACGKRNSLSSYFEDTSSGDWVVNIVSPVRAKGRIKG